MKKIQRVVLVYKKSLRKKNLLNQARLKRREPFIREDLKRLAYSSQVHSRTLESVQRILRARGIPYKAIYRARRYSYNPKDLIIAVGGDGTFLEAARGIRNQWILGVNSDPGRSVGTFCRVNASTFKQVLDKTLRGRARVTRLNRLQVTLDGRRLGVSVLNEILVTHRKPAAMSRYWIRVNGIGEEHRSSGLWIATASGSTGAIRSAGGRQLPRTSRAIQYKPRELYQEARRSCRLTGGVLQPRRSLQVASFMRDGLLCLDGEHLTFPFRYGQMIHVSNAPYPLHLVEGVT